MTRPPRSVLSPAVVPAPRPPPGPARDDPRVSTVGVGGDADVDLRWPAPRLPPRLVTRRRLLDRLDDAVARPGMVLVTAGPGGGKTVLLSQWVRTSVASAAWLALSRADDDPTRFWPQLVSALRLARPTVPPAEWAGDDIADLLDAVLSHSPYPERSAGSGQDVLDVVVLDDVHVLTDPQILRGLDRIVRRWSHRVRLVVATRSVPMLPLHQYRLAGLLHEVRAAELAMTSSETRELLVAHGVGLSDHETATLVARTEGWTGGLRLAALRMERSERPADFVAEMAMDGGSIGEYLVEEVLSVQPERVRRLLLQTGFLHEVSADAAVAVTGMPDAGQVLARLARGNSFVVPVDLTFTVFRYHQLFREVLRYLARQEGTAAVSWAQRRAVEHFRDTGDVASALHWAVRSGDLDEARSMLARGGLARAFVSDQDLRSARLEHLLRPDPQGAAPDALAATTRLAVAAVVRSRADAAAVLRSSATSGPAAVGDEPALALTRALSAVLLAGTACDYPRMDDAVSQLLGPELRAEVDEVAGLRGKVLLLQANARFLAGRPTEVEPLLLRAMESAEREGAVEVHLQALAVQALANASAARPRRANDALARAVDLLAQNPTLPPPIALDHALARRAYLEADLETMSRSMRRALAASSRESEPGTVAATAYLQALLLSASGRTAEAREWLRSPALSGDGVGLLAAYRDAELALLELESGRPQLALAVVAPHVGSDLEASTLVPAARARLALGDADTAERLLRVLQTSPSAQVDRFVFVQVLLAQAEVWLHRGDEARALEQIDLAQDLAGDEVVMPFVRMTSALAPLLARRPGLAAGWPAPVPARRPFPARGTVHLADPLTEREVAVLRLLTTTMSTAELAAHLYLSINTVKTHLTAIYRKIGVSRRRDAVLRARELELL